MYNTLYVYSFKLRYRGHLFNALDMNSTKGKKIPKTLRSKKRDLRDFMFPNNHTLRNFLFPNNYTLRNSTLT